MFIRSMVEVVAFSTAGDSVLIERSSSGPEGGGSLGYAVFGPADVLSVDLSSDFSNGGPDTPETISNGDCKAAAKRLQHELAARGFTGVDVRPEACAKERGDVVTIAAGPMPTLGDVTVALGEAIATVVTPRGTLSIELPNHKFVDARRAENGSLLVLRAEDDDGSSSLSFVRLGDGAPVVTKFPPKNGELPGF